MTEYRRFNNFDWQAWAGAEAFSTASDPFIWEKKFPENNIELTIIADKNGLELTLFTTYDGECCAYAKELDLNAIKAEGELRHLINVVDLYDDASELTYELDHPTHEETKGFNCIL